MVRNLRGASPELAHEAPPCVLDSAGTTPRVRPTSVGASDAHWLTGHVVEVLPTFGVARLKLSDKRLGAVNRATTGIEFDTLEVGQRLRCLVLPKFARILEARHDR